MNKALNVNFRLDSIKTSEFAIIDNISIDDNKVEILTAVGVGVNIKSCRISIETKFTFITDKVPFIILNSESSFIVDKASFTTLENSQSGKYIIPKDFIMHLSFIAVGTARGILHCKTENTLYNKYLLPTIDLTKIIDDDLTVG